MRRIVLLALCGVAIVGLHAQVPPRSVAVPESEVQDVFLAYLVGVVTGGHELDTDGPTLVALFPEFEDGSTDYPFHEIVRVRRDSSADRAYISVDFSGPLAFPVPVDVFGYHPGEITTSRTIVFDEVPDESDGSVHSVYAMRRVSGTLGIDFDRWLTRLFGPFLSDVDARVIALAELEDEWYAILGGDTPEGGTIVGVVSLRNSRILLRPPASLRELAEALLADSPNERVAP